MKAHYIISKPSSTMRDKARVAKHLSVSSVLHEAFNNFVSIIQWTNNRTPDSAQNAAEYWIKAEALIQMVEVGDCGGYGGYGVGQKITNSVGETLNGSVFSLFDRWLWLYTKYVGEPEKIKYTSANDYATVKSFFEPKISLEIR